jgi:hypothetical protein
MSRVLLVVLVWASFVSHGEVYYGKNVLDSGWIQLVAQQNKPTPYSLRSLGDGAVISEGMLAPLVRVDIPLMKTRAFSLTTEAPVLALLVSDPNAFNGSHFFVQDDGRKYWGNRFTTIKTPGRMMVFSRDTADVEVRDAQGTLVTTVSALGAGLTAQLTGLTQGQVYVVTSKAPAATQSPALVALEVVTGNSFAVVPPVPTEAQGLLEDCNNDLGTRFAFGTDAFARGIVLVFNPGPNVVQVSVTKLTQTTRTPVPGYQNLTIAAKDFLSLGPGDLGSGEYEMTSTGPVFLTAGSMQGAPDQLLYVGDDITTSMGQRGLLHEAHSLKGGAVVFASEDNTQLQVSLSAMAPTTATLNKNQFLEIPAEQPFRIQSTRPVTVQILGGSDIGGAPEFDDWSTVLRPSFVLDTDGNGLDDFAEGGACKSVAPDSDQDGRFDFEDADDDNDCLPDSADAVRTNAALPKANADDNCPAAKRCERATGACVAAPDAGAADAGATDAGVADGGIADAGGPPQIDAGGGTRVDQDAGTGAPFPLPLALRSYQVGCACRTDSSGDAGLLLAVLAWWGWTLHRRLNRHLR